MLGEHEALPSEGRYEPPASTTDGLQSNLIERRRLQRHLTRQQSFEQRTMRHGDYHRKVLRIDEERLDEHIYRALRGLLVELRVLRRKRLGGLLQPPAYQAELDHQQVALQDQLGMIDQLIGTALRLDGSRRADGRRVELPSAREKRQRRELRHTIRARRQLRELRDTTRQLIGAVTPRNLEHEPVELLVGTMDGQPQVFLPPLPTPRELSATKA